MNSVEHKLGVLTVRSTRTKASLSNLPDFLGGCGGFVPLRFESRLCFDFVSGSGFLVVLPLGIYDKIQTQRFLCGIGHFE